MWTTGVPWVLIPIWKPSESPVTEGMRGVSMLLLEKGPGTALPAVSSEKSMPRSTKSLYRSVVITWNHYCGWKKSCTTLDGWNPINKWDKPPINWCRISSINSITILSLYFICRKKSSASWSFVDFHWEDHNEEDGLPRCRDLGNIWQPWQIQKWKQRCRSYAWGLAKWHDLCGIWFGQGSQPWGYRWLGYRWLGYPLVRSWRTYSCRTEVKVPAKNLIGKEQFEQISVWQCSKMFQDVPRERDKWESVNVCDSTGWFCQFYSILKIPHLDTTYFIIFPFQRRCLWRSLRVWPAGMTSL